MSTISTWIKEKPLATYPRLKLNTDKMPTLTLVDMLCGFLLHTLHCIYIIYTLLYSVLVYCIAYWHTKTATEQLKLDKQQLTKIPKHLSLHVSSELASSRSDQDWDEIMDNVCTISCWAYEFGIKEISVFDGSGVMKSKSVNLHKRQAKKLKEWIAHNSRLEKVIEPFVDFSILSNENGKPHMGSVVRRMARQISNVEEMDVKRVDQYMHEDNISDADLMIVFGGLPHNYVSLDGYSPWHLRSTEFINYSNYRQLDYTAFSQCLRRFSKLEQRFGR